MKEILYNPDNLKKATVIKSGHITDSKITEFRESRNLFCK